MISKQKQVETQSDVAPHAEAAMAADTDSVSLPAGVGDLLSLFETTLEKVKFPGVSIDQLRAAVQAVASESAAVARARSELSRAESKRADAEIALLHLAEKGLAYAKVFAGEDAELHGQLAALQLGTKKEAGRRPRKPRPASLSAEGTHRSGKSRRSEPSLPPAC